MKIKKYTKDTYTCPHCNGIQKSFYTWYTASIAYEQPLVEIVDEDKEIVDIHIGEHEEFTCPACKSTLDLPEEWDI
jgi:ribosomal protein L37AE/L43A